MENFDLLDEYGFKTGSKISRSEAHGLGLWHRTVHIWMSNSKGDLLWQKRSLKKDTNPGLWDISAAGHIEYGQTSIDAAIREVFEETGIEITARDLKFLFEVKNEFSDPITHVKDKEFQDVYWCTKNVEFSELKINDEVDAFDFKSLDFLTTKNSKVDHQEEYAKIYSWIISFKNC